MRPPSTSRRMIAAGLFLGLGLGGFFDGIVLHQMLQWHHMVSHVDRYPTTTVAGLEANTLADGLFHAATWLFTIVGLWLLWTVRRGVASLESPAVFLGLLLIGWGGFNLVEGVVDHHLLGLHHVREDATHRLAWDIAFLIWGAGMVTAGGLFVRGARVGLTARSTGSEDEARVRVP
jgi:uncharacterized membrane protein